ncbi:MAG: hypothetical protein BroJett038_33290 [Chloroflexota bacterium]|nr:MAG: hypothetical protein BroJett038_33290 [Chloroflexota bacterium]
MRIRNVIWGATALVLVAGLTLQFARIRDIKSGDTTSEARPIGLGERVPLRPTGWAGRDEPLGPNEFIQTAVEKNLNYDDVLNRIYRSASGAFGLYAAYWSPGRMPVQKVASHTPDRCWSENGWTCEALRAGEQVPWREGVLKPAYWRIFTPPANQGARQYVLYWHLVGGELYDYGIGFNRKPNPIQWWRETVHYALKGSADQYFIRLTSDRPFEVIWQDPGFQEVLSALAKLGLKAES